MSDSAAKEPSKCDETSPSLSSLPDEVVLSCLARVPISDHATLSLVCKSYHNLVMSHELYKTRSLMGRTEEPLYICISTNTFPNPLWFVVHRENKSSASENRIIRIPSLPCQSKRFSSFVKLDWGIYVIGGSTRIYGTNRLVTDNRTSDVLLLDCRTNTWSKVTSMGVARASPAAGVVDGKIYVFGGCEDVDSLNWAEFFDPKTQTWDTLVPMTDRNEGDNSIRETFVMEEKVYAVDKSNGCFYYSPSDGKWGRKNKCEMQRHFCVIEKLLYGCDLYGELFWCESEEFEWKQVKGLETINKVFPPEARSIWKLRDFGASIVVFSVRWGSVWYGEVLLGRREEEGEVWGTIDWRDARKSVRFNCPLLSDEDEVLYLASVTV